MPTFFFYQLDIGDIGTNPGGSSQGQHYLFGARPLISWLEGLEVVPSYLLLLFLAGDALVPPWPGNRSCCQTGREGGRHIWERESIFAL